MKKIFIFIAALFVFSAPLTAYEWGGVFQNNTGASYPGDKVNVLNQNDSINLWLNTYINDDLYLSTEAMYKFVFVRTNGENFIQNILDVDLLKLEGKFSVNDNDLFLKAGRFAYIDSTSIVFAQTVDGLSLEFDLPSLGIGAFVGYTGLLNSKTVSMAKEIEYEKDSVYLKAYGYLPLGLTFTLPSILNNSTFSVQTNAFIDTVTKDSNLYYANLALSGPITNTLYYEAVTSLGSLNFKDLMNYTSIKVSKYSNDALAIKGGLVYASGNNGSLKPFTTVSQTMAVTSASYPSISGCVIPSFNLQYDLENAVVNGGAKMLLSCMDSFEAKGVQLDLSAIYNIFNDLQIGFSLNSYFDISGNKEDNNVVANINLSVAF